jgi:hypothetical protein
MIYAITLDDAPAERHGYDSAKEALHEQVCAQDPPMPCQIIYRYADADHAAGYVYRPGEKKPYVSIYIRPAFEIREFA